MHLKSGTTHRQRFRHAEDSGRSACASGNIGCTLTKRRVVRSAPNPQTSRAQDLDKPSRLDGGGVPIRSQALCENVPCSPAVHRSHSWQTKPNCKYLPIETSLQNVSPPFIHLLICAQKWSIVAPACETQEK